MALSFSTPVDLPTGFGASYLTGVYSGSRYLLFSDSSTATVARSSDGVSWGTQAMTGLGVAPGSGGLATNGSRVIATSGVPAYRTDDDGVTWASSNLASFENVEVCFDGLRYVAVCRSGVAGTRNASSADGATWTTRTNMPSSAQWTSPTCMPGTNRVCVFDYSGTSKAAYTTDGGTNWTASTLPFTYGANTLTASPDLFVASDAYELGKYATSPDGATWTSRTIPGGKRANYIHWTGTTFIAYGATDGVSYMNFSDDGIAWDGWVDLDIFGAGGGIDFVVRGPTDDECLIVGHTSDSTFQAVLTSPGGPPPPPPPFWTNFIGTQETL